MPVPAGSKHPIRAWLGRHERSLARGYLLVLVLAVLALAVPATNRRLLSATQSGLDAWDGRWTARVEHGLGLVTAGRYEEAVAYLERLDAEFPATYVRHARDQEREVILRSLGHAHAQLGRKGRALDAFRRAVLFDPLNYVNHDALGRTALAFEEGEEALLEFQEVLRLKPAYLPAMAEVVQLQFDNGDWAAITGTYRTYLDSFLAHHLLVQLGEGEPVPEATLVDGRFHELRVPLTDSMDAALRAAGGITLGPGQYGIEVRAVVVEYALPPGLPPVPEQRVTPPGPTAWVLASTTETTPPSIFERVREPAFDSHPDRRLRIPLEPAATPLAALRLELRLVKPVDAETWNMVRIAHRNRLEFALLDSIRARSFVTGDGP